MTQILIRNINIPATQPDEAAFAIVRKRLKSAGPPTACTCHIHRRSVDARKRDRIQLVLTIAVLLEAKVSDRQLGVLDAVRLTESAPELAFGDKKMEHRPVVVGFHPHSVCKSQ